jgi:hypothetical protein
LSLVLPLREASHGPPENIKDRAVMLVDATAQKTYKNSLTCTVLALEAKPPGTGGRPSLSTPWSGTGGQCQPLAVSPTHPNNVPCPPTQNWNASAVHRRRSVAHLESAIKETIARGARRQVRLVLTPLRRELLRLRKKVTELQATVTSLRRNAEGWKCTAPGFLDTRGGYRDSAPLLDRRS